jgi:hypothetical protein
MMTISLPAPPPPPAAEDPGAALEAGADELASLDIAGALEAMEEAAADVAGADAAAEVAGAAAAEVAGAEVAELELPAGVLLLPQAAVTVSRATAPAE